MVGSWVSNDKLLPSLGPQGSQSDFRHLELRGGNPISWVYRRRLSQACRRAYLLLCQRDWPYGFTRCQQPDGSGCGWGFYRTLRTPVRSGRSSRWKPVKRSCLAAFTRRAKHISGFLYESSFLAERRSLREAGAAAKNSRWLRSL